MSNTHKMRFRKYGQSYHLEIKNASDLALVPDLPEVHWVATGTPTSAINADVDFENYIDVDNNGRIMCFEVKDAITWLLNQLNDTTGIDNGSTTLRLATINTEQKEGKHIHESARKLLRQLGKPGAEEVTLEQVREVKTRIESTPVSEAGVVLPEAGHTDEIKAFIADIVDCLGGAPHPAGKNGVNQEQLKKFLELADAWCDWYAKSTIPKNESKSDIMPLGHRTFEAYKLYNELRAKLDQYFAQCDAVVLNRVSVDFMRPGEKAFEAIDFGDPAAISDLMKKSPISAPNQDRVLNFGSQINPYYADLLDKFRTEVVTTIFDRPAQTLSAREWDEVKEVFKKHTEWVGEKKGGEVEKLGIQKTLTYLNESYRDAVAKVIDASSKTAVALDNIREIEKLILYQANMLHLANNFVSFPLLYDPKRRAVFEMGTLVMDSRHLSFSVLVEDRAEHARLAKSSNIFVIYAEVMPGHGKESYEVAVPVTFGGKGNICVGKRGIFRDISGYESDAQIVQVIENPISIAETIVAPFQRMGKVLSGRIESMTSTAEKKLDSAAGSLTAPKKKAAPEPQKGMMAGSMLMGGSVAIAALSSAVAYVTDTLKDVEGFKIVIGVTVAILAVIMPASIIAMSKLRKRDLSSILEGAGWAINSRMRLTFKQGRMFTEQPKRPGKDLFSVN